MSVIPQETVEAAWRHVGSLDAGVAHARMEQIAERQPALLAHVLASVADSSDVAQGLAVYLYVVILEMFERHAGKPLPAVDIARVEHHIERNETLLDDAIDVDEAFLGPLAMSESAAQPYVMKYLVEALHEEYESDNEPRPSDDEVGLLFLTLKIAIDALDEATT